MKKILFFFLSLLPMLASADGSGTCGDNLKWTYVETTKTLTISGSGKMKNYEYSAVLESRFAPWRKYDISSVIIESGVNSIGNYAFNGETNLISVTIGNSVTSIGEGAFRGCSSLTSVTIPNSVTDIGGNAFWLCSGLTTVTIPNNVISVGLGAFYECSKLTSVTIGNGVKRLGNGVFAKCTHLKTIIINSNWIVSSVYKRSTSLTEKFGSSVETLILGNDITSIGDHAFNGFSSLTSVTIPNSVTDIGNAAFYGCNGLASVTIPNSVTSIGINAFYGCSGLTSVTIPNSVTSIGSAAFDENVTVYVERGSKTLLALWNGGITPYEINTQNELPSPYFKVGTTQTTISLEVINKYSEYSYAIGIGSETFTGDELKATGLLPQNGYYCQLYVSLDDITYRYSKEVKTQKINPYVSATTAVSSTTIECSYIQGDAVVTSQALYINNKRQDYVDKVTLNGLDPGQSLVVEYAITVAYGENGEKTYAYTTRKTVATKSLKLTTLQPKVVSTGNVIVGAETNLDEEETNVGFEWRRTDWTDDFASNTGTAYLYTGMMEGYIRNLNTEKLWKYRPYYLSNSGTYYYGDWMGLDPTNTSYFEPSVHTYQKITIEGNMALVRGYALGGTDGVTVQGFKYWKLTGTTRGAAPEIPSTAVTIEAKGQVMTATLTELDYETDYCYAAFATTNTGETFYGEVQSFTTGEDLTGIETVEVADKEATIVACYDMNGRRLNGLQRGLNILIMNDGTKRKVMVK